MKDIIAAHFTDGVLILVALLVLYRLDQIRDALETIATIERKKFFGD